VIDDQVTVIRVMERMLADDYEVISATSGESGITIASEKLPDLILLDMVMPGLSGIEVCQKLSNDPLSRNIPLFLCRRWMIGITKKVVLELVQ